MTSVLSSDTDSRSWWIRGERVMAGLTLFDGLLGLGVCIVTGSVGRGLPLLSLLALFAGLQAWRGRPGGHLAALAFYGLHLAAYHPFDFTGGYRLRGALNLGAVVYLPNAVVVLNVFAIGMFAASAALLWWRARRAPGRAGSGIATRSQH